MPDLTPEERHRIYQEEKARIEARESIEHSTRWRRGFHIMIAALIILGVLYLVSIENPTRVSR